jgi:large subunit ribosomal protein L10
MSDLRKNLYRTGASVCVAKNSVARLALKEIEQEELAGKISGQTALVWGGADSSEVSKILIDFIKESENISVCGGLLQGKFIEKGDVKKLSELPSREVLLSMLLSTIQAPLTRLAGALNAKTRDLVSVLKQLSEKKGGN